MKHCGVAVQEDDWRPAAALDLLQLSDINFDELDHRWVAALCHFCGDNYEQRQDGHRHNDANQKRG